MKGRENMRSSKEKEKTKTQHSKRKVYRFEVKGEKYELIMTKHGHYRILENKELSFKTYGHMLLSMGEDEIDRQFKLAREKFPLHKRHNVEWQKKVDYCVAVYDVINEMVLILGMHPHLKRITIVTIIPRIDDVFADVFAAYRLDNNETKNKILSYKLKQDIEMKSVNLDE